MRIEDLMENDNDHHNIRISEYSMIRSKNLVIKKKKEDKEKKNPWENKNLTFYNATRKNVEKIKNKKLRYQIIKHFVFFFVF